MPVRKCKIIKDCNDRFTLLEMPPHWSAGRGALESPHATAPAYSGRQCSTHERDGACRQALHTPWAAQEYSAMCATFWRCSNKPQVRDIRISNSMVCKPARSKYCIRETNASSISA